MLLAHDILKMLKEHEEVVAEFYDAVAGCSWFRRRFWESMAADERRHAELIARLVTRVESGDIQVKVKGLAVVDIVESRNFVMNLRDQTRAGLLTRPERIRHALQIEQDMIDKNAFQVLETNHPELRRVVNEIRSETQAHRQRLERECRRWF
ncbi:MAG: hypothetical protein A2498_09195 [Lentisphaerae bacterium RIFOXYC12_FULL_60_16]|nr:MAG: hypothetical protein A2498_09195 [Lentisphaerae bacterium RIFOXYC12_FULL_60_16]OGV74891.1 MAG: hypothetical protein A2340_13105 [Lentisphaerae bacterium RIFOXYB12_FULL_60_10]OGV75220.1 MAG: hypothetical protein A2269_09395 [Lentisphaerae bacterium RIFOXYA12_FULL_60_10]